MSTTAIPAVVVPCWTQSSVPHESLKACHENWVSWEIHRKHVYVQNIHIGLYQCMDRSWNALGKVGQAISCPRHLA